MLIKRSVPIRTSKYREKVYLPFLRSKLQYTVYQRTKVS